MQETIIVCHISQSLKQSSNQNDLISSIVQDILY